MSSKVAVLILHSHQEWMAFPDASHPCQHLALSVFQISAIRIDVQWCLAVLICSSLITYDVEHLFIHLIAIWIFSSWSSNLLYSFEFYVFFYCWPYFRCPPILSLSFKNSFYISCTRLFPDTFLLMFSSSHFFKNIIYLFIFRQGKRGRKRGRETSMCGCSHTPHNGEPGPQARHVPWLGIEPMTLWFRGWHSIHQATPARAWE